MLDRARVFSIPQQELSKEEMDVDCFDIESSKARLSFPFCFELKITSGTKI